MTTAQLRKTFNMAFDDSALSAFCLDYYPEVFDIFSQGMRKDDKITYLVDYCRRQPTGFETLLENVRKESSMSNESSEQLKPVIDALSEYIDSSPQISGTTAAQAPLEEMPTDKLPAVKSLPVGSRMLFGRYANFVGREIELRQLATILKTEHGGAAIGQIVATLGLGGIGKTQLAVEFAHRYGQYFAGIEGRKGILAGGSENTSPDWATPVLFMRAKDGHILQPMIEETESVSKKQSASDSGISIGDQAQIGEPYTGGKRQINTGGGTYIEGNVTYHVSTTEPPATSQAQSVPRSGQSRHLTKASLSPVIRQLAEHLTQQRLALFIGADLPSSVTGLPSRTELARGLAQREGLDERLTLAKLTQRMMRANNRWNFTQYIKSELSTWNKTPQRFHQLLIELPVEMMITTTYDDLLRRAFEQSGLAFNHLVKNSDFSFTNHRGRSLLKLYGDLSQLDSLIITEDDHYGLWRNRDKESLLDEVRRITRRQAILFLGYNLADPDFNLLWREVLDRMGDFAIGAVAVWPNFPPDEQQVWQSRQIKLIDAEPVALLEALLATVKL